MKQSIIIVFVFLSLRLFAQGNLQFNQVLLLDGNSAYPTYTVPAGKVWKLESFTSGTTNGVLYLTFNGSSVTAVSLINGGSNLPFWIPEGTVLGVNISQSGKVSILEFNIVP
jgi:hypothetical protein